MAEQMREMLGWRRRFGRRGALRAGGALAGTAVLRRMPLAEASARTVPAIDRLDERKPAMVYEIEGRLLEVCTSLSLLGGRGPRRRHLRLVVRLAD